MKNRHLLAVCSAVAVTSALVDFDINFDLDATPKPKAPAKKN